MGHYQPKIAIAGAEHWLGQQVIEALLDSGITIADIKPVVATGTDSLIKLSNGESIQGFMIDAFDFSDVNMVMHCAGSTLAQKWVPKWVDIGLWVIDLSSAFHGVAEVPMIVPAINGDLYFKENVVPKIVTQPSCVSLSLSFVLDALQTLGPLQRVDVATYQSMSGLGEVGVEQLVHQSASKLNGYDLDNQNDMDIGFNVLPSIDQILANGYTKEEERLLKECQRVLGNDQLVVNATAVRVPTFYGHGAAIHAFFGRAFDWENAKQILNQNKHFSWEKDPMAATPVACMKESPPLRIARVRQDWVDNSALHLWLVSDNIHRGVAWNAVELVQRYIACL